MRPLILILLVLVCSPSLAQQRNARPAQFPNIKLFEDRTPKQIADWQAGKRPRRYKPCPPSSTTHFEPEQWRGCRNKETGGRYIGPLKKVPN